MPNTLRNPRLATLALLAGLSTWTAPVQAQTPPFARAVIAAQPNAAGSTIVWDVDLATGAFTALPAFSTDAFSPLAIATDPIDHTVLIALENGTDSQIMRRRYESGRTTLAHS